MQIYIKYNVEYITLNKYYNYLIINQKYKIRII